MEVENPSKKKVKRLLKSTFMGRRKWVIDDIPPVRTVLDVYPALQKSRYVSYIMWIIIPVIVPCF